MQSQSTMEHNLEQEYCLPPPPPPFKNSKTNFLSDLREKIQSKSQSTGFELRSYPTSITTDADYVVPSLPNPTSHSNNDSFESLSNKSETPPSMFAKTELQKMVQEKLSERKIMDMEVTHFSVDQLILCLKFMDAISKKESKKMDCCTLL